LPDTALVGPLHIEFTVMGEGQVEVPAGTFDAFEISSETPPYLGLHSPDVTVRGLIRPSVRNTHEWVSEGVGVIQYEPETLYKLARYAVPVEPVSWSHLKWLYR